MNDNSEGRLSGGLIIAAVLGALVLMLHHPTSFKGPDDGLLLNDWSNTVVHGAMIVCLFLLRFAFGTWARRLGTEHASVRAGTVAFHAGMTAFIGAALISGFAASGLADHGDPDELRTALHTFVALNRALANLGMVLTAAAMALWSVRMLRLKGLTRAAGGLGLVVAVVAAGWLVMGQGAFGLYPATVATVLFGAWSLLVASRMIAGEQAGEAG